MSMFFTDWPTYNVPFGGDDETMGGTLTLAEIFRGGLGLGSQMISAWSGPNSGTQIGYNPNSGSIFAIQPPQSANQYQAQTNPYAGLSPAQIEALQAATYRNQRGGVAEDLFGGLTDFISKNPLPIAAIALGAYLLMREPPKRR